MATFQEVFGDGSDGAYTGGALVKGQTYNFTSFYLDSAVTLGAGNGNKIVIKCQGDFEITSSGSITSNADGSTKDSAAVMVNGMAYSVASTEGANGTYGTPGVGASSYSGTAIGGHGGRGGLVNVNGVTGLNGTWGGSTSGLGGSGGVVGGNGQPGEVGADAGGGGGGGGGASPLPAYQNGILIVAGGNVVLNGAITGNGCPGNDGGDGGHGGNNSPSQRSCPGGGGGGGAGGQGGGGMSVVIISLIAHTGTLAATILGGNGGSGGNGGAAGSSGLNGSQPGVAGTAGTTGIGGAISYVITANVTPLVDPTIITNIFATQADAASAVLDDGGATITERGFVYSLDPNPTV